jgi:hypothetical protein
MKVVADGEVALQSYADLLRFTNAPRLVKPENEKNDICFFLPAFKVHPQLFLRLSRQFTSFQFQIKPEQEFPERGEILPATLNFQEANKGVKIVMAELANDKKKIFPLISSVKVQISEFALIYVPFRQIHGEYVQPALQIGINCNALR